MKEFLINLIRSNPSPGQSRNLVREYLQERILESMQRSGAMIPLAFHGGTALRLLYRIGRFSEDLDFALERPSANYNLRSYLKSIQAEFLAESYNLQIKMNDQKTVQSAYIRFYDLLFELNLSPQSNEALSIKIEVDSRPPSGAVLETSLVRHYVTLRLQHHDRSSLLAGKLHALFTRSYAKGRDLYDLVWYLSDRNWPAPNLQMLTSALLQTGWQGEPPTEENWQGLVYTRLKLLDWKAALADVKPFLEKPDDLDLITLENLRKLLHQPG
jgi:predicted nucleotidyltransferase component of viral defense system